MKRVNVLWLFALVLMISCKKSEVIVTPADPQITKPTVGHLYFVTISPVNEVNTTCSNLLLSVQTNKTSRGTIVLCEYEDTYQRVMIHRWEATNTNSTVINTGDSKASERYFDATFTWGSTIISAGKTVEIEACPE